MGIVDLEKIEIDSRVVFTLSLDNPASKNSMTWEMGEEFYSKIEYLKTLNPLPACLIITGRNNIFSSGGNLEMLKGFAEKSVAENRERMFKFYNFFLSITTLPFPVIGAINGSAIGAGFALSLACDVRVFAREGKYSFNFVRLGIHPGMGSSYLTKELFGLDIAKTLLFMADTWSGDTAYEKGICYDVVAGSEVLQRANELAISICESSPIALRLLKKNLYDQEKLADALRKEAEAQSENFVSEDFIETIRAIEEKRKPVFRDR
ncbi:MAG: enoyl-CoA hydratase/isomerase family protein [Leptospira sp.]|nr:enoyl-CoA hydratase/isomerase family protein [Leptospira sp.]